MHFLLNDRVNPFRLAYVFFITGIQVAAQYVGYLFYNGDVRTKVSADENIYKNPTVWFFYNNGNTADTPFWEFPIDVLQISIFIFLIWVYLRMAIFSYGRRTFRSTDKYSGDADTSEIVSSVSVSIN